MIPDIVGWGVVLYVVGALADAYTTKRAVIDRAWFREANPVGAWLIAHAGEGGLWLSKLALLVVLLLAGVPQWLHGVVGLMFLAAGAWNWRLIRRRARRLGGR